MERRKRRAATEFPCPLCQACFPKSKILEHVENCLASAEAAEEANKPKKKKEPSSGAASPGRKRAKPGKVKVKRSKGAASSSSSSAAEFEGNPFELVRGFHVYTSPPVLASDLAAVDAANKLARSRPLREYVREAEAGAAARVVKKAVVEPRPVKPPYNPRPVRTQPPPDTQAPVIPQSAANGAVPNFAVQRRPAKELAKRFIRRFLSTFRDYPELVATFFKVLRQGRARGSFTEDVALRMGQLFKKIEEQAPQHLHIALEFDTFLPSDIKIKDFMVPSANVALADTFLNRARESLPPGALEQLLKTLASFHYDPNPSPEVVFKMLSKLQGHLQNHGHLMQELVAYVPRNFLSHSAMQQWAQMGVAS